MDYGNTAPSAAEMSPGPSETDLSSTAEPTPSRSYGNIVTLIPQEYPTMFDPNDAGSVSRFFQSLADKVVLASTLPKEVEELRSAVDALKRDVESYREYQARADEEISNLRRERAALQDENATLRREIDDERNAHRVSAERLMNACNERDRWHDQFISASSDLETVKRERDDAQMRVMQLEDELRIQLEARDRFANDAAGLQDKLNSIRSALA